MTNADYGALVSEIRNYQKAHEIMAAPVPGGVRRPDHEEEAKRLARWADAIEALVRERDDADAVMLAILDATSGPGDGPRPADMIAGVAEALAMPAIARARTKLWQLEHDLDGARDTADNLRTVLRTTRRTVMQEMNDEQSEQQRYANVAAILTGIGAV